MSQHFSKSLMIWQCELWQKYKRFQCSVCCLSNGLQRSQKKLIKSITLSGNQRSSIHYQPNIMKMITSLTADGMILTYFMPLNQFCFFFTIVYAILRKMWCNRTEVKARFFRFWSIDWPSTNSRIFVELGMKAFRVFVNTKQALSQFRRVINYAWHFKNGSYSFGRCMYVQSSVPLFTLRLLIHTVNSTVYSLESRCGEKLHVARVSAGTRIPGLSFTSHALLLC